MAKLQIRSEMAGYAAFVKHAADEVVAQHLARLRLITDREQGVMLRERAAAAMAIADVCGMVAALMQQVAAKQQAEAEAAAEGAAGHEEEGNGKLWTP